MYTTGNQRRKKEELDEKELHENLRHITQLGMSWFAFFVTTNYLTMGWLAGSKGGGPIPIRIVAAAFIVQNLLGIFGIGFVAWHANRLATREGHCETSFVKGRVSRILSCWKKQVKSIPVGLYTSIAVSLMIVLASLAVAWGFIWHFCHEIAVVVTK